MNKTFCPFAWNHFSARVDGYMRLCCNGGKDSLIKNNKEQIFKINEIGNLLDYYNLDHFKRIRKNMLGGIKNLECNHCYNVEEKGGTSIRNYAAEKYPYENFKNITNIETGEISNLKINYIDFAWSNKCNLQCRMCDPNSSDQLIEEFSKLYGPVKKSIIENKTFWIYDNINLILESVSSNNLAELLVTGGEPLINNDFYRFCEFLIEKDYAKNVSLSFHTNLTVTPGKWSPIFSKFKRVVYKVSIDAVGDAYEYIRYPGKWNVLNSNINEVINMVLKENSNIGIEFHSVLSIFNAHCLTDLLDYLSSISRPDVNRITAMPHFNYVYGPDIACPRNYPLEEKIRIKEEVDKWIESYDNSMSTEFLQGHDRSKLSILKAVIQIMFEQQSTDLQIKQAISNIKEVDQYRNQKTYKFMPWIKRYEKLNYKNLTNKYMKL